MRRLLIATAFLTRLPVTARGATNAADLGRAMLCFPLVGAALWAVLGGAGSLLAGTLPAELAAILVVAAGTAATGALHLDGLADSADGLGGGRDPEHALRIMRDHAIGAFGAAVLVLALLAKAVALAALLERPGAVAWLATAGALSRWVLVPLARLPPARAEGLGASISAHVSRIEVLGATVLALGIAVPLAGWRGIAAGALAVAACTTFAATCVRRVGGMTGDTLGAATELAELTVLIVGVGMGAR